MKKYLFLFTLSLCVSLGCFSQSISSIFRMLPADCTPDLKKDERDNLLSKGDFIVPGGDSLETISYSIDSNAAKKYLRYEFYFTTGQSGFNVFEVKVFTKTNGEKLVLYSRYGGTPAAYNQQELRFFRIQKGKLVETKEKILPKEVELAKFLKPYTPASVKKIIMSNLNSQYDLNPKHSNTIEFQLAEDLVEQKYEKYIAGHVYRYQWNGAKFIGSLIPDKK